ncbi:MAG: hypothetical protein M3Y87_01825 [Myxococcota bacterium]|nr:hypothetical protein [Myxococcota bacterium]
MRVRDASAEWALVTRGRLIVTVWRADVTPSRIDVVDRAIQELTSGADPYASVTVVERSISMRMTEEAREASHALQRKWGAQMRCSAYLVEGEGFLPAAVRTMTAGMALVTRSPYPVRVFRDIVAVSSWVAPHAELDVMAVEQAITRARLSV